MFKIKNPKDMKSVKPKKFSEVLEESTKVDVTLPPVEDEKEPKVELEGTVEETVTDTDVTEEVVDDETTEEESESVEESEVVTEDEDVTEESSDEE